LDQVLKYYRVLGLEPGAPIDEIKKAYRKCARRYHPDINKSATASDRFIITTEAYQFLLAHHKKKQLDSEEIREFINEWERYQREQARRKAYAHARIRYARFVNSDLYRSTKVLDKTRIFIAIIFSLLILILAINGYIARLKMVDEGFERPPLSGFVLLIFVGLLFLVSSLIFLYHHYKDKK